MNGCLINKSAVRDFILGQTKVMRPGWKCTRISAQALDEIDAMLRFRLAKMVHMHPSRGVTFTEVQP